MLCLGLSLIFLLALSLPLASAVQTNAERLRRGLPPLSPRRPSKVDMARRDSPSNLPLTVNNAGFTTFYANGTPRDWTITSGNPAFVDDGSGTGSQALKLTGSNSVILRSPIIANLIPNTAYTITFKWKYTKSGSSTSTLPSCPLNVGGTLAGSFQPRTSSTPAWLTKSVNFNTASSTSSSSFEVSWSCSSALIGTLLLDDFSIAKA